MRTVELDCPHGRISLSIDQAESLIAELKSKLEHARRSGGSVWDFADENGMINRERFYQYFEQFIPERAVLRNRAGKLYAAIVRAGMTSHDTGIPKLPLMIICGACGRPVITQTDDSHETFNHTYYRNSVDYQINLHDVHRFQDAFMPHGSCALVGRKLTDFELLLTNM